MPGYCTFAPIYVRRACSRARMHTVRVIMMLHTAAVRETLVSRPKPAYVIFHNIHAAFGKGTRACLVGCLGRMRTPPTPTLGNPLLCTQHDTTSGGESRRRRRAAHVHRDDVDMLYGPRACDFGWACMWRAHAAWLSAVFRLHTFYNAHKRALSHGCWCCTQRCAREVLCRNNSGNFMWPNEGKSIDNARFHFWYIPNTIHRYFLCCGGGSIGMFGYCLDVVARTFCLYMYQYDARLGAKNIRTLFTCDKNVPMVHVCLRVRCAISLSHIHSHGTYLYNSPTRNTWWSSGWAPRSRGPGSVSLSKHSAQRTSKFDDDGYWHRSGSCARRPACFNILSADTWPHIHVCHTQPNHRQANKKRVRALSLCAHTNCAWCRAKQQ